MGDDHRTSGPRPQGLGAQGPGNAHGIPADHEPDVEGRPFSPEGGRPAQDPDAMARKVLNRTPPGPASDDGAGSDGAGGDS